MIRMKLLTLLTTLSAIPVAAQEQERPQRDMPVLEIPEITIIGKKVITLPFARKGEVIAIKLYEPPPPDTSILAQRVQPELPRGILPHPKETRSPWRFTLSAHGGSFSTRGFSGLARYSELLWEGYAEAGFSATNGHTRNTQGSGSRFGAGGQTYLVTDNNILGLMRMSGDFVVESETYGMFVQRDTSVERTQQRFKLTTGLTSADGGSGSFQFGLTIRSTSLTDREPGGNLEASAIAPTIRASFATHLGSLQWSNELTYETSSLTYTRTTDAPSVFSIASTARWQLADSWSAHLGLKYEHGADSDGGSGRITTPVALLRWQALPTTQFSAFWEPSIRSLTYADVLQDIPYLTREPVIRNPHTPFLLGVSASHDDAMFSLSGTITAGKTTDAPIPTVSGRTVELQYADVTDIRVDVNTSVTVNDRMRITASGTILDSKEQTTDRQLPMTPALQLRARAEWGLPLPATVWAGVRFRGPQDVDIAGTSTLPGVVLLDVGISSTIIPSTIAALELSNVFGSSYDWWLGYRAPGLKIMLRLQTTL